MSGLSHSTETGVYILTLCIRSFADQFQLRLLNLFFFFLFIMKQQQKLIHFLKQKRIAVEHEKHEDGLDKKGEAHDSLNDISCSKFQYHSLT